MFRGLDNPSDITKRRIISNILRKMPPTSFEISDDPETVDFEVLKIRGPDGTPEAMIDRLLGNWVEGRQWSEAEKKFAHPVCYRLEHIVSGRMEIRHFYGPIRAKYDGWKSYRLGKTTLEVRRAYVAFVITTFFESKFIRFATDRFELLAKIVDQELSKSSSDPYQTSRGSDSVSLYLRLYGHYAFAHQQHDRHWRHFQMLIESLKEEGALREVGGNISVAGSAMTILSDYAIAKRRHRDAVIQNWAIIFLTIILIIATALGPLISEIISSGLRDLQQSPNHAPN